MYTVIQRNNCAQLLLLIQNSVWKGWTFRSCWNLQKCDEVQCEVTLIGVAKPLSGLSVGPLLFD